MNQPSLFDQVAAEVARDLAIEAVDFAADPQWKKAAESAILHLAATRLEFTTDDVWEVLHELAIEQPREPRALGAAMRRAARNNLIVPTDRVSQSLRPECHRRPVRVWRSLVAELV